MNNRDNLVAEYTAAEYRYIAALALRKALEAVPDTLGSMRRAMATEQEANDALIRARKTLEAHAIPVNTSPVLTIM